MIRVYTQMCFETNVSLECANNTVATLMLTCYNYL